MAVARSVDGQGADVLLLLGNLRTQHIQLRKRQLGGGCGIPAAGTATGAKKP
jgi:hypothetical protein